MRISFVLTALLVISSCQQYYDYNVDYAGDKLVVNGSIDGNGTIKIALSKSQSPAGFITNEGFNIKNGRVWLYENDKLVFEEMADSKGKIKITGYKPQVGNSYRIKAVADDLDTIVSDAVILPNAPNYENLILRKDNSYVVNTNAFSTTRIGAVYFSVKVKDDIRNNDYYMLDSHVQINKDSVKNYLNGTVRDESQCEFEGVAFGEIIFTDKCFNGGNYEVEYFSEHEFTGTMNIELSIIDKTFYKYLRSVDQPTDLELAFSEPNLAVSNIKNGYGMFVAKNTKTFSLKLD
jgi:hypothetical protein